MKDTNPRFQTLLYVLLVVFMVLTFYAIFNAGNPRSIFRLLVRDPGYDVLITVVLAACVGALVILLNVRQGSALQHLLEINREYILQLRRKGQSDGEIADSFLQKLGSRKGMLHALAKRRVLRYLSQIE
jgi:hypothetical protein